MWKRKRLKNNRFHIPGYNMGLVETLLFLYSPNVHVDLLCFLVIHRNVRLFIHHVSFIG